MGCIWVNDTGLFDFPEMLPVSWRRSIKVVSGCFRVVLQAGFGPVGRPWVNYDHGILSVPYMFFPNMGQSKIFQKKVYPWENQRFGDHPSHSPRFCPQNWFVIQKGVDVGQWGYTKYLRMCIQPVFRHIMCLSVIDISCRWWTNYSVACPNVCVCVCTFCFVVFSFTVFFLCICLCLLCICIHVYECNVCK